MKGGPSSGLRNDVRLLALTPDFPPVPVGLEVPSHRLIRPAEQLQTRAVQAASDPNGYPSAGQLDVCRAKWAPRDRLLAVSLLNVMRRRRRSGGPGRTTPRSSHSRESRLGSKLWCPSPRFPSAARGRSVGAPSAK
jgi:hypothetical protein